jgi:glutamate/tyrosine decarboxylase-like PLP-dependent enzyme
MTDKNFQLERQSIAILKKALDEMEAGFRDLPGITQDYDYAKIEEVILELARGMQDNYPYFHPLYAGQMLKPPHPAARIAYMLSLWINPNNHALDGGKATSGLEKEAVAQIASMFGWKEHLGHLTGGGTMSYL